MRLRAKRDANHGEIVRNLRAVGCSVQDLANVGDGCPDLLVGFMGKNFVFEVKDGSKPESAQRLTADEDVWLRLWRGKASVVNSVESALRILGIRVL